MNEHTATLSQEGRVLIPASIRHALGLKAGDALILSTDKGELRLRRRQDGLRQLQQRLKRLREPGNSAVEELLRERRAAAAKE